jgi:putative serine protease PepD
MEYPESEDAAADTGAATQDPTVASTPAFPPTHWRRPQAGPERSGAVVAVGTPPNGVPAPPVWPVGRAGQPPAPPVWGTPDPVPAAEPGPPAPSPAASAGWGRWVAVALVAAVVGAAVGGGVVATVGHSSSTTDVKEISAGPALLNGTTDIESVIAKVLPAVVSIDATSPAPSSSGLFGGSGGGGTVEDQGTGLIITPNGEVVTNNHVITGATTITVTLYGQTKAMPTTLVDTDPTNDIALLQITGASNLPTATYGNSDDVQVGDAVVAIGNALGLSAGTPTVTQGIISAEGRTVQAGDQGTGATETLTNMFQTDAAINPGNSGGPLVDSSGKVIGMNTAVASGTDGTSQAQNIGFAIPANRILSELPDLRAKKMGGSSTQGNGYLGVSIETMTPQLRSAYNFVPSQGAIVTQVDPGSPAALAGLEEGDVIVTLDGKSVTSADQLASAIQADKAGQSVTIGLYRGEAQLSVTATLASSAGQGSGAG